MTRSLRHLSAFAAAAFAFVLFTTARADDGTTIKFSDPAKPGTFKIALGRGDIRIKGADVAEVSVKSELKPVTKKPRKDGLRVLTASTSYSLTEKDNLVTLDALGEGWAGGPSDFQVTVPRNTNIVVASSFGGDIMCAGVAGDLEIKNMSGEIRLDDVTGGALVETMNGEIRANVRELHDGKPLSFTSMNGEVILRVPADAKATVRLRTQNGSILTDFDEASLVTKTENTPRTVGTRRPSRTPKAAPVAPATPATPAAPAAPALSADETAITAAAKAKAEADADRQIRNDVRETVRDAVRIGIEASRDGMAAAREALAEAGLGHFPPMPPLPPMTGGKLVTGTLHGGGPEISVATMNGDVTLRQLEAKK